MYIKGPFLKQNMFKNVFKNWNKGKTFRKNMYVFELDEPLSKTKAANDLRSYEDRF